MKIIVGLGNIGANYKNTYHNVGFMAAELLCSQLGFSFSEKSSLKCRLAMGNFEGEKVVIVLPSTYMNLSGECVSRVLSYYKCDLKDLLVVYDDLDLPLGSLRFRERGSAGTHNGMRNIVAMLSSTEFARARIGTMNDNPNIPTINYVLSNITTDKMKLLEKAIEDAASLCKDFIKGVKSDMLMCTYNKKTD